MSKQWKYNHDGNQQGPIDEAQLIRMIQGREVPADILVCREGTMHWQSAKDVECFRKASSGGQSATSSSGASSQVMHSDRIPGQHGSLGASGSKSGLLSKLSKPIYFSLAGAVGCLAGAIIAELALLLFPNNPQTNQTTQNVCVLVDTSLSMAQGTKKTFVDIMFVLDVTGSMDAEIEGIKNGIKDFAGELGAKNLDAQIGLIGFGDLSVGERPEVLTFDGSAFTSNMDLFSEKVGSISRHGGGDLPESSFDAIVLSAEQSFRNGAIKTIILITDAPPQTTGTLVDENEVKNLLGTRGINNLHLVIKEKDHPVYSSLQSVSPGEVYPLRETASGGKEFDDLLPIIGRKIAEKAGLGIGASALDPSSKMAEVKRASASFVERQRTNSMNIAVLQFGDEAKVVHPLTTDIVAITNSISQLVPNGKTALDLGLDETMKQFPEAIESRTLEEGARDFVVLFTDGKPNDEEKALAQAQRLRDKGVHLFAIHTADAPAEFLNRLTADTNRVISTKAGDFESAFVRISEKIEETPGIVVSSGRGGLDSLLRNGLWFALIAMTLGLAFAVAQNMATSSADERRGLGFSQVSAACLSGLIAGFAAGNANLLFERFSQDEKTVFIGGVAAWALLAAIIGFSTTYIIANFKTSRAVGGGLMGGLIGGVIFNLIRMFQDQAVLGMGEMVGRLIGAIFVGGVIGLFIAWVEQLTREAYIVIHWGLNEESTINLGQKPVTIGNQEDDIFVNGLPQCTLSIVLSQGRIIATQQPGNSQTELKNQSNIDLGKIQVVVHALTEK